MKEVVLKLTKQQQDCIFVALEQLGPITISVSEFFDGGVILSTTSNANQINHQEVFDLGVVLGAMKPKANC